MVVILAGVAWWFTSGPGAYRTTPRLIGLTLAEAQGSLRGLGVGAVPENRHDDNARPGTVIDSSPRAGQQVHRGGSVVLYICDGPAQVTVPELANLTEPDAKALLAENFLTVHNEIISEYDDKAPKGTVLSAEPTAGTRSTTARG